MRFRFTSVVSALLLAAGVAVASDASPVLNGDADAERERLAVIHNEITYLQTLVAHAQAAAPSGQRVTFRYEWLLSDLELLKQGLSDHIDAPHQPRPVVPLRGDYRQ